MSANLVLAVSGYPEWTTPNDDLKMFFGNPLRGSDGGDAGAIGRSGGIQENITYWLAN
ncbi:hypothetical protein [Mycobacterium sp. 1165178.9]|uniref:hypothetical protein n=1 Tax=Mycobacterium sp. 1165178.9 TaxID=1834070 RepID=UPI0012EB0176|nr:hypothetical protein [Mycobacterium sp. 1165178.9]